MNTEELMFLLKTVLGILPFLVLCLANAKINLNKANRAKQFAMPIIALVYCITGVILLDKINVWVYDLYNWVAQYVTFLQGLSWQYIATYVLNAVLVVGFILIKFLLLPLVAKLWDSNKLMELTCGWLYEREEDVGRWLLKPKFANFRGFVRGMYYTTFAVAVIVFLLSQNFPEVIFFQAAFYPVFGVLVLGEVVSFMAGLTKSEFVEDILGEDEEAYKVANYGSLREILRDLFSDRVLHEGTCDTSDGISTTFDELDEMVRSDDPSVKRIGSFYMNLKNSGADVDINYVRSSVNLLNGKSTLFCNPFYRDLTHYLTLPMVKQLISYKKCLIVLGRDSMLEDVNRWADSVLENFTNTDSLWQANVLTEFGSETDVGILKFSDIHNLKIHKANREFLSKVGFVLIIEPSRILASGQIGLSLLVNNCETPEKDIVYCACDRNCDGLVDALSHTLKTSITEVTATVQGGGNNSQMYWDADGKYMHHKLFPNISRYLGMGTEINAVAMKYQLEETGWVGSEKFPVLDMKWIAGQYHKQICQYADLPQSQAAFDRAFNVYANLWGSERKENSFLVVEDEFQNLFEITRIFASRAKSQGFINVISENYFLRDYMLDNVDVFTADPKAIPTIVPDYARTERNMVLKLVMMMVYDMVSEERVAKELMLCGIPFEDPYATLKELISKHCHVEDASLSVRFREELQNDSLNSNVVKYFEINETNELYSYAQLLKNAYYIAEDEEGDRNYIGAKLYGHVFQAMLPGQFMTFDSKYYEVHTITPQNGVVVRRAADHITGRRYYRQIRNFIMDNWSDGVEMGSKRTASEIEITRGYANIAVKTEGYLDMSAYGNLATAQKVSLNGIPERNYRNKNVLKIRLPERATSRVRYTICLLMNEIFRTTYPETYHYIAALTPYSDDLKSENLEYATYRLDGDCEADCIYIVEDSDIDLGLIVSVERNLKRYLEIIAEVLNWHAKKMQEQPTAEDAEAPGEEASAPVFGGEEPAAVGEAFGQEKPKRKGLPGAWDKVKDFFKKFGKKKKKGGELDDPKDGLAIPGAEAEEPDMPSEPAPIPVPDVPAAEDDTPIWSIPEDEQTAPAEEEITEPADEEAAPAEEKPAKKTIGQKIKDLFKKFGKKKKKKEPEQEPAGDEFAWGAPEDEEIVPQEQPEEETVDQEETAAEEADEFTFQNAVEAPPMAPDVEPYEDEDDSDIEDSVATEDIGGEDEVVVDISSLGPTKYQKNCFVKFGYEQIDPVLDLEGTGKLLEELGFDKNPLQQVREIAEGANGTAGAYDPHKYGVHCCDFCGVELLGGEYEMLKDGRERCNRCSMTAIKKVEDFKALYKTVLRNMEAFYGIKLNVAVKVRTTNAKQIAKHVGTKFVPTPGFDGRVLGFAQKDKTGYSLYIENGSPKLAAAATIAHELTHIWQYLNWNDAELTKKYGKEHMLEVYEGMAKWAEIQYLMLMNEKSYAKRQEITTRMRNDEYGKGFIVYAERYPLSTGSKVSKTPFKQNPPL